MKILIIEDDLSLSKIMKKHLVLEGYDADVCDNGGDAFLYISDDNTYDAIILDRMLPEVDGLTILSALRRKGFKMPVIMVTALGQLTDRIDGLDAGADDYLVKPFEMQELLARLRALLRRPYSIKEEGRLKFADLSLNEATHILSSEHGMCELSKKEYALFEYLIKNTNTVLSRDSIINYVWGSNSDVSSGNLDNYISFIRRRLESVKSRVQVKTVHSMGYRLIDTLAE